MLLENNAFPYDRRVLMEATALTDAGYRVTVISPALPGQPWHEVHDGVRAYRFPAPPASQGILGYLWEYGYSMTAAFALSLLVFARHGFDVVHAHNPPDTFVFIAAFYKCFGVRFVFDHHDLSPEMYYARFEGKGGKGNRFIYATLVWLERLTCRVADRVIATNESYKAIEMQRDRVPEGRISIVRNGPNLERVRRVPPDPDLRRKAKTIIGYVGVMGFQDGVDYLLRALAHLVNDLRRPDFFCVLIGTGDAWTRLRALTTELRLDEHVWLTGLISDADVLRYLSTADICVDPDPSNPFTDRSTMTKMMEYMALEKPIVAFDLPEHRFTAQEAAVYVRPNDELAFARALAALMDEPDRRRLMGSFGRRRVESVLCWHFSVPHLLETYKAVFPDGSVGEAARLRERPGSVSSV